MTSDSRTIAKWIYYSAILSRNLIDLIMLIELTQISKSDSGVSLLARIHVIRQGNIACKSRISCFLQDVDEELITRNVHNTKFKRPLNIFVTVFLPPRVLSSSRFMTFKNPPLGAVIKFIAVSSATLNLHYM